MLAAIWFLHLTIAAQTELKGSGDKLTESSLPSPVCIVRGNALLSPVYWLLFMSFIIHITFLCGPHLKERRGLDGIYVDKYVENWLSMDSFTCADLFVWWQTEVAFVYLPAGSWLSPSMARHSGDKHQLVAHSTDTTTSSRSQQITF